jgi:SAM-dependent methyltransferase
LIRLDLGSGPRTPDGFWGIDRYPLPNVDVVASMDDPLPFKMESVDLLLASHSLEHAEDLMKTMKEIYRVCKHGAQVCIVAPYFSQGINFANPYHKQAFNEHTPRFWTQSAGAYLDREEYNHPHADTWGLSYSDYSQQGIDFRCVRMEFLYFPEYRRMSPDAQRDARKKYIDVCDQIIYYLIVIKDEVSKDDMDMMIQDIGEFEPPGVTVRKLREKLELLNSDLEEARIELHEQMQSSQAELLAQRESARVELDEQMQSSQAELVAQRESARVELDAVRGHLKRSNEALVVLEDKLSKLAEEIAERDEKLKEFETVLDSVRKEIIRTKEDTIEKDIKIRQLDRDLQFSESQRISWTSSANALARDLDAFRGRRSIQFIDRVFRLKDLRGGLSLPFIHFLDDSAIFIPRLKHYKLNLSRSLHLLPYLEYPLDPRREGLSQIELAISVDVPSAGGHLALQVLTHDDQLIRACELQMKTINVNMPVSFEFKPICESELVGAQVRISSGGSDVPIRLYQWERSRMGGLIKGDTRLFGGYRFGILSV